jgi:ABC-2 type transport system ATP-binding protein
MHLLLYQQKGGNKMSWLEIRNISKKYNDINALQNIDYSFNKKVLGIIGPNGAGKSTLIGIMEGLIQPSSGEIKIFGKSSTKDYLYIHNISGFIPEKPVFYQCIYVSDFFNQLINNFGIKHGNIEKLVSAFKIEYLTDKKLLNLSNGEMQIIWIVSSLLNSKKLIILDEPYSNLDYWKINKLMDTLKYEILNSDLKVIITTHRIDEIIDFADEILFINKGKKLFSGDVDSIINRNKVLCISSRDVKSICYFLNKNGIKNEVKGSKIYSELSYNSENIIYSIPPDLMKSILRIEFVDMDNIFGENDLK